MSRIWPAIAALLVAPLVSAGDLVLLYDQTGLSAQNGKSVQHFEHSFSASDSFGADEFGCPVDGPWLVEQVRLVGRYKGSGSAVSVVNIAFYTAAADSPGTEICATTGTVIEDAAGNLVLNLQSPCELSSGTYWLSAQIDLSSTVDQWFWDSSGTPMGSHAMWRNPSAGFPTLCTTWGTLPDCFGSAEVSFLFAVYGQKVGIFSDGFESSDTSEWSDIVSPSRQPSINVSGGGQGLHLD